MRSNTSVSPLLWLHSNLIATRPSSYIYGHGSQLLWRASCTARGATPFWFSNSCFMYSNLLNIIFLFISLLSLNMFIYYLASDQPAPWVRSTGPSGGTRGAGPPRHLVKPTRVKKCSPVGGAAQLPLRPAAVSWSERRFHYLVVEG